MVIAGSLSGALKIWDLESVKSMNVMWLDEPLELQPMVANDQGKLYIVPNCILFGCFAK